MPGFPWRRSLLLSAALAAGWLVTLPSPARASATVVVNTTADLSAPCQASAFSLRCAIVQANADGSAIPSISYPSQCAGLYRYARGMHDPAPAGASGAEGQLHGHRRQLAAGRHPQHRPVRLSACLR